MLFYETFTFKSILLFISDALDKFTFKLFKNLMEREEPFERVQLNIS